MNGSHFEYSWKKYESSHYIFIYLSAVSVNLNFRQNVQQKLKILSSFQV